MKLLTIDAENGQPGVVVGDGQVLNLSTAPESVLEGKWRPSSVREILERDSEGLDAVRRIIGAVESNLESHNALVCSRYATEAKCLLYTMHR